MLGIGQDTVVVTPISMLRVDRERRDATAICTCRIFLRNSSRSARSGRRATRIIIPQRPGFGFQHPEPKMIEMTPEQEEVMVKGMWGVVNGGGTAGAIRMPEFRDRRKDRVRRRSPSWERTSVRTRTTRGSISFAPAYKPEISVIALIENSASAGFARRRRRLRRRCTRPDIVKTCA